MAHLSTVKKYIYKADKKKKNNSVDAAAHGQGYSFHVVQRHKVRLLGSAIKNLTYFTNEGNDIKRELFKLRCLGIWLLHFTHPNTWMRY